MRRVVWAQYVSVDGVVENPSWTTPFWNDEIARSQRDQLFRSDALLLGRITYQLFADSWPGRTDPEGFADRMNRLPKYVASRTLKQATWNGTVVIQGEVSDAVARLKQEAGGDVLVYGSGTLVRTLFEHDLIDEYRLMVHPLIVGHGNRLFPDGVPTKTLRLTDVQRTSSGIATMLYEPAR
jgi:dihydrofolate reductase